MNEDINDSVKEMTTKLLTYESKLLERDADKRATKTKKASSNGGSKGGNKSGGDKIVCTYKPWKRPNLQERSVT